MSWKGRAQQRRWPLMLRGFTHGTRLALILKIVRRSIAESDVTLAKCFTLAPWHRGEDKVL